MKDPQPPARAAMLSAALSSTPLPDSYFERHLRVPAIRRVIPQQRPPLDLDAAIFRYRVYLDGTVEVIDEPAGARTCRERHRR